MAILDFFFGKPQPAPPQSLFTGSVAWFSPLIAPDSRALWCAHGGVVASIQGKAAGEGVTHYIGLWHKQHQDPLVLRLIRVGVDPVDFTWVTDSVAADEVHDRSVYAFSHISRAYGLLVDVDESNLPQGERTSPAPAPKRSLDHAALELPPPRRSHAPFEPVKPAAIIRFGPEGSASVSQRGSEQVWGDIRFLEEGQSFDCAMDDQHGEEVEPASAWGTNEFGWQVVPEGPCAMRSPVEEPSVQSERVEEATLGGLIPAEVEVDLASEERTEARSELLAEEGAVVGTSTEEQPPAQVRQLLDEPHSTSHSQRGTIPQDADALPLVPNHALAQTPTLRHPPPQQHSPSNSAPLASPLREPTHRPSSCPPSAPSSTPAHVEFEMAQAKVRLREREAKAETERLVKCEVEVAGEQERVQPLPRVFPTSGTETSSWYYSIALAPSSLPSSPDTTLSETSFAWTGTTPRIPVADFFDNLNQILPSLEDVKLSERLAKIGEDLEVIEHMSPRFRKVGKRRAG